MRSPFGRYIMPIDPIDIVVLGVTFDQLEFHSLVAADAGGVHPPVKPIQLTAANTSAATGARFIAVPSIDVR